MQKFIVELYFFVYGADKNDLKILIKYSYQLFLQIDY